MLNTGFSLHPQKIHGGIFYFCGTTFHGAHASFLLQNHFQEDNNSYPMQWQRIMRFLLLKLFRKETFKKWSLSTNYQGIIAQKKVLGYYATSRKVMG
jgi:hypothetical protein